MTENVVTPLKLHDGYEVETVFYGSGTLCLSTQAGCRMACPFCASGRAGLIRNLTMEELQSQLNLYRHSEPSEESHSAIKRLTLSGIGEPLDNLEVVREFIASSDLPVSVTTSVPDASLLLELINTNHNGVMLSLHSGTESTHKKLVPKATTLDDIFSSLSAVWSSLSNNKHRKIGFNYLLFEGVNDSLEEIDKFIERVKPYKGATVHLLYCNPVDKSKFSSPTDVARDRIYDIMVDAGLNVRRANRWRKSKKGGCGTLFLKGVQKNLD
ncbi:MAG: radical SAM protein [Denitrovibrio sp.]|nr:MAG: radical SAM protein [Denitrovibrio sp.]